MRVCAGVCGLGDQVGDTACHLRNDLQEENIHSGLGRRQHRPRLQWERGTRLPSNTAVLHPLATASIWATQVPPAGYRTPPFCKAPQSNPLIQEHHLQGSLTEEDPGGREGFYITCHSKLPETLRKILQVLYRKILFFTCPSWPYCHQKEQGWGTGGGALPLQNIDPQPTSGPSQRALCLKGLNFLGYHSSHPNMSRKHPFPYTSLQTPLSPACP